MRLSSVLFVAALAGEGAAFQFPVKNIVKQLNSGAKNAAAVTAGAGAAALVTLANPLVAQAAEMPPVNPAAVVLNVEVPEIDAKLAKEAATSVWQHRGQLQQATTDFVDSVKKIGNDLDGVLPPPPGVGVVPPEDIKAAARDALSGQARVEVNGNPVYLEVNSDEGFLTVRVLSPLLPKLPFLAPTEAQRETMVKPPPLPPAPAKVDTEIVETANGPFWKRTYVIPVVGKTVTTAEIAEGAVATVVGAYATTFLYWLSQQSQPKKKPPQPKMAKKGAVKDGKPVLSKEEKVTGSEVKKEEIVA